MFFKLKMKSIFKIKIYLIFLIVFSFSQKPKNDYVSFSGYLFVKQLYSGPDAIKSILNSKSNMQLKYFSLNKRLIYFSPSKLKKNQVEDSIKFESIINNKIDNITTGKCCVNVNKKTYPINLSIAAKYDTSRLNLYRANYCIEIKAEDISMWRICSEKQNLIAQFHLNLIYNILRANKKKNKTSLSKIG
jgi:hypothetical protein